MVQVSASVQALGPESASVLVLGSVFLPPALLALALGSVLDPELVQAPVPESALGPAGHSLQKTAQLVRGQVRQVSIAFCSLFSHLFSKIPIHTCFSHG